MGFFLLFMLGGVAIAASALDFSQGSSSDEDDGASSGDTDITVDGNDITGTDEDDTILAIAGQLEGVSAEEGEQDHVIQGLAGDDFIRGGDGNDVLVDSDTIESNHNDNDTLYGGAGSDVLYSFGGQDSLYGGLNEDYLQAVDSVADRPDLLNGGYGDDALYGDDGDTLTGGEGADLFGPVVEDLEAEEAVTITDFTTDDVIEVNIVDPDLLADTDAQTVVANVSGGAMIRINGVDVAFVEGATAAAVSARLSLVAVSG